MLMHKAFGDNIEKALRTAQDNGATLRHPIEVLPAFDDTSNISDKQIKFIKFIKIHFHETYQDLIKHRSNDNASVSQTIADAFQLAYRSTLAQAKLLVVNEIQRELITQSVNIDDEIRDYKEEPAVLQGNGRSEDTEFEYSTQCTTRSNSPIEWQDS